MEVKLDLNNVLTIYSNYVDVGDVDRANFFLTILAGFIAFLKYFNIIDQAQVTEFIKDLRLQVIEGPDYLNPYVMELLGILEEELNQDSFNEFMTKLRMLLREERLDRLEV